MSYSWDIIGERIRHERKDVLNLSQKKLAERIADITGAELKYTTVAAWEGGQAVKKVEQLTAMCSIFECDMAYLLGEIDTKRVSQTEIAGYLGLSEQAIGVLRTAKIEGNPIVPLLSALIEDSRRPDNPLDDTTHGVLERIGFVASMDYGPGSAGHTAHFSDAIDSKETIITITPREVYQNSLYALHKSMDAFIATWREQNDLPDYE